MHNWLSVVDGLWSKMSNRPKLISKWGGVLGSAVVSAPTVPKVCGSNPSGGIVGILAFRPVRMWILVYHLGWKVMPRRSKGTLNRCLIRVACALSNTDFKDPDPQWGREIVRAGYTHIPSIQEGKPHKTNAKIGLLGQFQAHNSSVTYLRYGKCEEEHFLISSFFLDSMKAF